MIVIEVGEYGHLRVDGDPVVIINHSLEANRALLCCKSGRNVWITSDDYLRAVMLPAGKLYLTLEQGGLL
jgi:hypothetical protein